MTRTAVRDRPRLLAATAALAALAVLGAAPSPAQACPHAVKGQITAMPAAPELCSSPWGWCTDGELTGRLRGDYFYTFTDMTPAGRPEAPWLTYFAGSIEITLRNGDSIFGIDNGTIDLDPAGTGAYASVVIVTGGTGAYDGATGYLVYSGTIDLATGEATGTYDGKIDTVDSHPRH